MQNLNDSPSPLSRLISDDNLTILENIIPHCNANLGKFLALCLKISDLFYGQPADSPFHSFAFCLLKASFTQGIKKDISSDCLFLLFYLNCLMIWHSDICPLTDPIFSHSYSIRFLSFQQPSNSRMYYLLYF